jgi:hypothetical protein
MYASGSAIDALDQFLANVDGRGLVLNEPLPSGRPWLGSVGNGERTPALLRNADLSSALLRLAKAHRE